MTDRPTAIRVVLCDDVAELRVMVRHALEAEADMEVVGEASDGLEGVEQVGALQPDVVVVDLSMPRLDGLQAIPRMAAAAPDCGIVVFSGFSPARIGARALRAGADRYLQKGAPLADVCRTVREVAEARRRGQSSASCS